MTTPATPARPPVVSTPVTTAEELQAAREAGGAGPGEPIVLDVRWHLSVPKKGARGRRDPSGLAEYDEGHVPGAVFVDVDTELAGPPGPAGRHPLPDPDDLQDTLRRAGARPGSTVVVYDGGDGLAAARAWWVLRWAGLAPERVAVLDGGWPAWVAAGGEVTSAGGGVRPPGDITVSGGGMPVLTAPDAARLGEAGGERPALLDARAAERFRGETEPIDKVAGHVPGAANLPASSLVDADGRWRPPAELAELFGGVTEGRVGAYCGSGVSAAMLVLGLERSGVRSPADPAGLYVGSWSHWSALKPARPVETGPGRYGPAS